MYSLNDIKSVQIEITERCNAACPACTRNYFGYGANPGIWTGNMTLDQFKILLPEEFIQQLNDVSFCGNLGDAQMNPFLHSMMEYLFSVNPEIWVCLNTNGSMYEPHYWAEFAKYGKSMQIVWGIDGTTQEVHSFYRRNTDYNNVMKNARAFIDAGGNACWQFILFKHNQHQLEEAKTLAKEYNFNDIFIIKSDRPNDTPVMDNKGVYVGQLEDSTIDEYGYMSATANLKENTNIDALDGHNVDMKQTIEFGKIVSKKYLNQEKSWEKDITEKYWLEGYLGGYANITDNFHNVDINNILRGGGEVRFVENRKIDCMAVDLQRIFITADGYVYPCCMMGLNHTRIANEYTYDTRELLKYAGMPQDVNDALKHGSVKAVFDSGFMNLVKRTWEPDTSENAFLQTVNAPYNSKNGNLHICASTCSNCNIG